MGVIGDEAELRSKNSDAGAASDTEEVFWMVIVTRDLWSSEIIIEMFDFLVAGKEH